MSRSTVSRALREDPRIRTATRRRVFSACRKLRYAPHALISDLAAAGWEAKRALTPAVIAYLDRSRSGVGISPGSIVSALGEQAARLGYKIEVFRLADFVSSSRMQKSLRNRGITDLILGPAFDEAMKIDLDWRSFVCVQLLPGLLSLPLHSVVKDHFQGVLLAWRKAVEFGYRRIGITLLEHSPRLFDDILRLSSVRTCLLDLYPHLPALAPYHDHPLTPNVEAYLSWLRAERPEVIIGFTITHLHVIPQEERSRYAFVCLHKDDEEGVTGIPDPWKRCAKECVNLISHCRRTNQWGLQEERIDHVIEPTWFEGNSMPRRDL